MRAYAADPLVRWLYPDDVEYEADGGLVLRYSMRRWLAWGETFTTPDVVAFAAWIAPGRPTISVLREPADGPSSDDLLARYRALGAVQLEHTPTEPHWYLSMLATHPDWQGLGLGRRLVSLVAERASGEGLGCYVETQSTENVAFYRGLGFEARSEWDVPLDGPHMWGMWRSSTGSGGQ
jgi:ribosomal protein S18 acetylase RimI-like enzyme